MHTIPSVIMIALDDAVGKQIEQVTRQLDFSCHQDENLDNLFKRLDVEHYDIIILTSNILKDMSSAQGEERLKDLAIKSPHSQILLLTESQDIDLVGVSFRIESLHFVKLPVSSEEIRILLENAFSLIEDTTLEIARENDERLGRIIGVSQVMQKVYKQIRRAASTEISVMLIGETGTGKDLASQAIHQLSKRNQSPYIPVNLGALPTELIGSELFGHEKGAFTGATAVHKGKFEQAKNGTLFLDEIESIDEKTQISLLRILEESKFNRLGGAQFIKSNARLIVASNEDLKELVNRGKFRKDLFYRLDVFGIELPALRKRYGDIPILTGEFLAQFSNELGTSATSISSEVLQSFESYEWPGNVRELRNVLQRAVLMCDGDILEIEHLPTRFSQHVNKKPVITFDVGTSLDQVERVMIIRALEVSENNRKAAADLLGISRRALYNKLAKHQIE